MALRLTEAQAIRKPLGAGFMVSFVRGPEAYRSAGQPPVVAEQKPGKAEQPSLLTLPPALSDEELQEQAEREWDRLPLLEQARKAVNAVNMFYGARLTAGAYGALTRLIESGEVSGWDVRAEAARAAARKTLDASAESVKARLSGVS